MSAAKKEEIDAILAALRTIRLMRQGRPEAVIHTIIAAALDAAGIAYEHEARIGPRMRPDFLTAAGIVIEVKKKRPNATSTLAQVGRYAGHPGVRALVLVCERGLPWIPSEAEGKPVRQVALSALWGIAT